MHRDSSSEFEHPDPASTTGRSSCSGAGPPPTPSTPRAGSEEAAPPGRILPAGPEGFDNIEGRRIQSVSDGFGELWFKRFSLLLRGQDDPVRVMATWRADFDSFWPGGAHFLEPDRGMRAGEVAGVELKGPVGAVLATGVALDSTSPTQFTLRTIQGHMFAGWIRFSTRPAAPGTEARIEMAIRPSDPVYQVALWLGGNHGEDRFWEEILSALARRFEEDGATVERESRCVSRRFTWRNATNLRYNAGMRSTLARLRDTATAPVRRGKRS